MQTADAMALDILLDNKPAKQKRLRSLAVRVDGMLLGCVTCPDCGHEGPHENNGATSLKHLSYSCAGCGLSFDAEGL